MFDELTNNLKKTNVTFWYENQIVTFFYLQKTP